MKEISLYIHIPFCKQKCLYCDFPSYARKDELMEEYIEALSKEILEKCNGFIIKSLFIGGGTPSYLTENTLISLMSVLKKVKFKAEAELTIECNPGTVSKEKFEIIKEGGINRLSFGLQTTKASLLKSIGRIHSYEEFKKNYILAREVGFENINIDMMFGLPNQSLSDWLDSLSEIIELKPEHISAYGLIIEEGTPFYEMYSKGLLKLPSEDIEREMYNDCKKMLELNGYHQYEISNYAIKNKECFHNKVYWKCEEYLGVGASASSYIDNKRVKNIDDLREYISKIKNNETVVEEVIENLEKDNIEEFMFMGLRMLDGIEEEEFEKRFCRTVDSLYKEVLRKNIYNGLLIRNGGRIYLSAKGIELSNRVMSDMLL